MQIPREVKAILFAMVRWERKKRLSTFSLYKCLKDLMRAYEREVLYRNIDKTRFGFGQEHQEHNMPGYIDDFFILPDNHRFFWKDI